MILALLCNGLGLRLVVTRTCRLHPFLHLPIYLLGHPFASREYARLQCLNWLEPVSLRGLLCMALAINFQNNQSKCGSFTT